MLGELYQQANSELALRHAHSRTSELNTAVGREKDGRKREGEMDAVIYCTCRLIGGEG